MTRFDIDWSYMRTALTVLAVASLVSLGSLAASYIYAGRIEDAFASETAQRNALRAKLRAVRDDELLVEKYLTPYLRLEQDGMIGEEQRLVWVDALQAVSDMLKLPSMHYRIAVQKPFAAPYTAAADSLRVNASRMELNVGLLHEEDLLRLFGELGRRVPDTFHIDNCTLRRTGDRFVYVPKRANLAAACQLLWFSLQPSAGTREVMEDPI
ncbi:MAG TPA: hypothetical protein ENI99_03930 [Sedimenticola sp.]|nr:hypothetical protein [Sedimenticola sp.]